MVKDSDNASLRGEYFCEKKILTIHCLDGLSAADNFDWVFTSFKMMCKPIIFRVHYDIFKYFTL